MLLLIPRAKIDASDCRLDAYVSVYLYAIRLAKFGALRFGYPADEFSITAEFATPTLLAGLIGQRKDPDQASAMLSGHNISTRGLWSGSSGDTLHGSLYRQKLISAI
jgi:hypothetical protein